MSPGTQTMETEPTGADETLHPADVDDETEKASLSHTRTAWHMAPELHRMKDRDEEGGEKPRKLGVTWKNLTVKGVGGNATFNENVLSQLFPFHKGSKGVQPRTIIEDSYGCVKPGEMLLVLGRPGAGCTTLLNVLANNRLGYEEVTGDVNYGNMSAEEAKQWPDYHEHGGRDILSKPDRRGHY